AGDIGSKQVIDGVKDLFSSVPEHKKIGKERVLEDQSLPELRVHNKKTDQTHMVMGFRTFGAKDKRRAALAVLSGVLGRGMSSRLFQRLREDMGVCYYVRAGDSEFTDHGHFTISTGVDNKRVGEVVKAIIDECSKMKDEVVSDAELKKAKDYIIGNLYMGLETTDSLAEFYADQEVTKGKIDTPHDIDKEIRKVTGEEVRDVARDIFKVGGLNLAIVGNIKDQSKIKNLLSI
ncbi:MAG: M16 family metallopeptidase, partial [Minisyncoccota bacterium]